jgi:hypothetical protein
VTLVPSPLVPYPIGLVFSLGSLHTQSYTLDGPPASLLVDRVHFVVEDIPLPRRLGQM